MLLGMVRDWKLKSGRLMRLRGVLAIIFWFLAISYITKLDKNVSLKVKMLNV